jgi:hypothetical protein
MDLQWNCKHSENLFAPDRLYTAFNQIPFTY